MTPYDFVQLTFLAMGGEIKGKTKLQKIVYFLGLALKHEEELGYRAHFYGPYSDEVASSVERLKTLGFLDHTVSGMGVADGHGFEVARHDYRLNDSGRRIAQAKAKSYPDEWGKIQTAAEKMKTLLDQDYMKLSIAAKTKFMLKKKSGSATPSELKQLAPRFGWDVTDDQIKEAANLLRDAHLDSFTD